MLSTRSLRLTPRTLRIFLASPADVAEERRLVSDVVRKLENSRTLRGRASLRLVHWDAPDGGVPMLLTHAPQDSVNRGTRPSECDVVIGVIWGRMGTPLANPRKTDGSPYLSGTEWELEDGLRANRPVLLYRRSAPVPTTLDDPELDEKRRQKQLVDRYFESFRNPDGSLRMSYRTYESPEALGARLYVDLELVILDIIKHFPTVPERVVLLPAWLWFVLVPLLLECLGLLIEYNFNRSIGRTVRFGLSTPAVWFTWGLKSLVAPAVYLAAVWLVLRGVLFIARLLSPSGLVAFADGSTRRTITTVSHKMSLDNPIVMSQAVAILGGAAIVLTVWRFWFLILAFSGSLNDASPEQLVALSPQNISEHEFYGETFSALTVLLILAFCKAHRARVQSAVFAGVGWHRLALCTVVLAIVLAQAPYKVLYHSMFEVAQLDNARCYVLGGNRSELLLYCPRSSLPRERVVRQDDPRVRKLGLVVNIYADIQQLLEAQDPLR